MSEEKKLPEGWIKLPLEVITVPTRISVQPQEVPSLPYIGLEHIEAETMRLVGTVSANELKSSAARFGPGDVLYGRLRPYLNKVFRPDFEGICSPEFLVFRESDNLNSRYLQYFLNSWRFKDFAAHLVEGDRPRVDWQQLKIFDFPLPPLCEQQRIVSAIEERFTILDAVTATLQQNKQKLKLARASVLKHAVEGKLTEKWRAEHPATESGQQLLERILAERRAKWEAEQLAKGKDPRKLRYEEPKGPDVSDLPDSPEGWCWASLGELAYHIGDVDHKMPKAVPFGIPYISTKNFYGQDAIDFEAAKQISHEDYVALSRKIKPERGDILLSRYGTVGEVRKVSTDMNFQVSYSIAIVKIVASFILANYLIIAVKSETVQKQIKRDTRATAQPDLGLEHIRLFGIPLPPLAEQQQIVAEVERRLSVIEQAEAAIETSLKRIERARQSILERAFLGRLVPQDPNDEPASVLLERIQGERTRRVVEGKRCGSNGGIKVARGKKVKEQEFVPQWQLMRDAQPSGLVNGSLSGVSAHENGAAEKGEVEHKEMGKEELGDLVQMPLLWD